MYSNAAKLHVAVSVKVADAGTWSSICERFTMEPVHGVCRHDDHWIDQFKLVDQMLFRSNVAVFVVPYSSPVSFLNLLIDLL